MKTTHIFILSGLLLCGYCTQTQAKQPSPAIDLIQAGKDTSWHSEGNDYVVHVTKRDGTSLEGVTVTIAFPSGKTQKLSSDTATLSPGSFKSASDSTSVIMDMKNVTIEANGKPGGTIQETKFDLHE